MKRHFLFYEDRHTTVAELQSIINKDWTVYHQDRKCRRMLTMLNLSHEQRMRLQNKGPILNQQPSSLYACKRGHSGNKYYKRKKPEERHFVPLTTTTFASCTPNYR